MSYKEYKKDYDKKSKGLGDTIKKITQATGIDKLVKFVAGEDCGCDERQKILNTKFRYDIPDCLNEEEYTYLKENLYKYKGVIKADEQRRLLKIYNRIFKNKRTFTNCGSCAQSMVNELKAILQTYETKT